ncbi:MAG TPA: FtsX-like permease family protein [Actinomycetota bacterium]|nr:FtsX-like permease family protein [Actinomycetota bacterium]
MWKATIKGLLAHKVRLGLTALAVVLGVGFISGSYVLTDTMNSTFGQLFVDATKGIDVIVRAENAFEGLSEGERKPVPESLLDDVRDVDGVSQAAATVDGFAQIVDKNGEAIAPAGPPTLGVAWTEGPGDAVEIRSGRPPRNENEVVIDARTAEEHDFAVGDRVEVLTRGPARPYELVGIAGFGEADNLGGATLAMFEFDTAQRLLGKPGEVSSIEAAGDGAVPPAALRARIAQVLPNGIEAATAGSVADEQAEALQTGLGFFNTALLVFAGVALFVGSFIIFNTFSIVVAQRTKELALLRALGASRGQVTLSVLAEALLVGVVASAIGLAAGILIAAGLRSLLEVFGISLPSSGLELLPRTVIASLGAGTIVTLLSSVAPARRASRVAPLEALRDSAPTAAGASRRRALAGAIVIAAGLAILMTGLFGDVDNAAAVVGGGAAVLFLGVAIASPLVAGPLARAIGAPLPRVFGVAGTLARANAARSPRRTASTAVALMVGLALVAFMAVFAASLKASFNETIDESLRADFIVMPMSSFAPSPGFSPRVVDRIAQLPEIGGASPLRFGEWRQEGTTSFLAAIDPATIEAVADLGMTSGDLADLDARSVLVHEDTAADLGLALGDALAMEFAATGTRRQTLAGTFTNNSITGADYVLSMDAYRDNFQLDLDAMVLATAAPGTPARAASAAIEAAVADFPSVEVSDQAAFKERQSGQVDQLLGLVTALLGLALVIALLGITNTLVLSVFERTRELGLLRAVGMSRRQTRAMVRWEAVIISIIGALLGLCVGIFFGWALVTALESEGITRLVVPGGQLLAYLVLAALAGVIAALPPARRAARLNVLEAVATE